MHGGFASRTAHALAPVFPLPAPPCCLCPHSSVIPQYRNLNLLPIGYASPPRLRTRLTQGRSALPWNPWIFGRKDSHLTLATHSGILSSYLSTAPSGTASSLIRMLLYQMARLTYVPGKKTLSFLSRPICKMGHFLSFGVVFQPRTFSAQDLSTSELLRTL